MEVVKLEKLGKLVLTVLGIAVLASLFGLFLLSSANAGTAELVVLPIDQETRFWVFSTWIT